MSTAATATRPLTIKSTDPSDQPATTLRRIGWQDVKLCPNRRQRERDGNEIDHDQEGRHRMAEGGAGCCVAVDVEINSRAGYVSRV